MRLRDVTSITCSILTSHLFRFVWPSAGTWDLHIRNVQLEDDAIFDCQIPGTKSPPARLTVLVPPDNLVIEGAPVKRVIENQDVRLVCISEGGKPAPKVRMEAERVPRITFSLSESYEMSIIMKWHENGQALQGSPASFP